MDFFQEIIKVTERIPHIGTLTKVIPLKFFLDIVPSSSEDATRAMRVALSFACSYLYKLDFKTVVFFANASDSQYSNERPGASIKTARKKGERR